MIHQDTIFRVVRGACENAANAHPEWRMDPRLHRSVAKRATGTLTALQREVLAALKASSGEPRLKCVCGAAESAGSFPPAPLSSTNDSLSRASHILLGRAAWRSFRRLLTKMEAESRTHGKHEFADGVRAALSMFDANMNRIAAGKIEP